MLLAVSARPISTNASSTTTSIALATWAVRAFLPGPAAMQWSGARTARDGKTVSAAAQRFDGPQRLVGIELAAQASDEYFDHVAVALVILVVEPLGELGLR